MKTRLIAGLLGLVATFAGTFGAHAAPSRGAVLFQRIGTGKGPRRRRTRQPSQEPEVSPCHPAVLDPCVRRRPRNPRAAGGTGRSNGRVPTIANGWEGTPFAGLNFYDINGF